MVPVVLCTLTLVGAHVNRGPFGSTSDYVGLALFLAGSAAETVSELQRKAFKDNPDNKGKVFSGGLFSFARQVISSKTGQIDCCVLYCWMGIKMHLDQCRQLR